MLKSKHCKLRTYFTWNNAQKQLNVITNSDTYASIADVLLLTNRYYNHPTPFKNLVKTQFKDIINDNL